MKDLSEIRAEINRVDRELVALFCRRMDCAKAVGEYKKENGVPVLNLDREKEILDRVEEEGGEYGIYTRLMYQNIMELSRALQHKIIGTGKELREKLANATHTLERQDVLVGYQGIEGANSHEASQILFPHAQAPLQAVRRRVRRGGQRRGALRRAARRELHGRLRLGGL